jgi:hypothetical protein
LPEIRQWRDWGKGWREGLQRLPQCDQLLINNSLLELLKRLAVCSHALEDDSLAGEVVYLVARTAIHNHDGLNRIVAGFQP